MKKEWRKADANKFEFLVNDQRIGSMTFNPKKITHPATFDLHGEEFSIHRTGFWKTRFEIRDKHNLVIASSKPNSWLGNSYLLQKDSKSYTLKLRNKPLAQWVIFDGAVELLYYGLSNQEKKASLLIGGQPKQQDYMFDMILWFLFEPIIHESLDNNLLIIMSAAAA